MLSNMKKLLELRSKAKKMQKQLSKVQIESEHEGIIIIFSGEQQVVEVKIPEDYNTKNLNKNLKEAFNKGLKKAQEVAASQMKDIMGDLGLPGMLGGQ